MQALSSSALGAPVATQAASDPVEGETNDLYEPRRAAVEQINASQRHRLGVLPGVHVPVITVCACSDYKFDDVTCICSDIS